MDITGDAQDNTLTGTAGNDTILGLGGNDTIDGLGGNDTADGGEGDDTLIYSGGVDVLQGGADNDRIVLDAQPGGGSSFDGGAGSDTLVVRNLPLSPATAQLPEGVTARGGTLIGTTLGSFERVEFSSSAATVLGVTVGFGFNGASQIDSGISATAELIGGGGFDSLALVSNHNAATMPGGYVLDAPSFTYTNWQTTDRAYRSADRVAVIQVGNANGVINGSSHVGIQGLTGGGGNDTINGSDGMDLIAGGGGFNQLHGGGGDDTLTLANTVNFATQPGGQVTQTGPETTFTGAGSLFDGGAGFDFLMFGGNVAFEGTIESIEGVYLAPGYVNALPAGGAIAASQFDTRVSVAGAALAQFPTDLEIDGIGTIAISLVDEDDEGNPIAHDFDGSDLTFTAGADITFEIEGGDAGEEIVGTATDDVITANGGDDLITGGLGDDEINGGMGMDTVFFADAFADCTITYENNITIVTTKTQGVDRLRNVEKLNFAGVESTVVLPNDTTAPTVVFTDNVPGTGTAAGGVTYTLTFSEDVTDLFFDDFTVTNGHVLTVFGSDRVWTVLVDPIPDFEGNLGLTLNAGRVFDTSGNPNAAASAQPQPVDTKSPTLVNATPANLSTAARVDGNIVLEYSEPVFRGTGSIALWRRFGLAIEIFDLATSPRISISGNVVTIDPTEEFEHGEAYYLEMFTNRFRDAAGNPVDVLTGNNYSFSVPPILPSILYTSAGLATTIGGDYVVFGTQIGLQDVTMLDRPGTVSFEGSFNSGGDIIRLPKDANEYAIATFGAQAQLTSGDSVINIPIGTEGMPLVFADGVRELVFSPATGPTIGGQQFGQTPVQVTAMPDGTPLPTGVNGAATGTLYLAEDTDVAIAGDLSVVGTNRPERLEILGGTISLDGSFNRGGDELVFDDAATGFTARVVGAQVVLAGNAIEVAIPVGDAGMTLDFAGDERLIYVANGNAMIDDQVITTNAVTLG